jgi:hypothetical protein
MLFSGHREQIGSAMVLPSRMLFRTRRLVAVLVMATSVALTIAALSSLGVNLQRSGVLAVGAALLVGTVALAWEAWWGRLLPLAWSVCLMILGVLGVADHTDWGPAFLGAGVLLSLSLTGKEMFARFEGKAPPPLDWTGPGMRLVRATVVASLSAFLGGVALAPAILAWNPQPRPHPDWHPGNLPMEPAPDPTGLLVVCVVLTVLLLIGVILLARQRTAGLLLVGVAALGVPVALVVNPDVLRAGGFLIFAAVFGPALLCGWISLGRFVPGMVRLLRG